MSGLDDRFVTSVDLSPYLVDKDTGAPLAGGQIYFYEDSDHTVLKPIYTLTGVPPAYTYTQLPNPLTLNATGNVEYNGNNIALYYFPYDGNQATSTGILQLYYVSVYNSAEVFQFDRQGWPNVSPAENANDFPGQLVNQISNSQFVTIFNTNVTYTFTGAGTSFIEFAPGWTLFCTYTGNTTVTLLRNTITYNINTNVPNNPPYTLTITPGPNITSLYIQQTLFQNSTIWQPSLDLSNGYVASSILTANDTEVTISYVSPTSSTQQLLSYNNTSGNYVQFNATVQLTRFAPVANASALIQIGLSTVNPSTISNIQVLGLNTNLQNVAYNSDTVNRQIDNLFHFYNPLLQYKPVPSFLIGWDFSLNPAQFLGSTIGAQNTGNNKSFYAWDQTIVFQSITSGVSISRGPNGEFVITATVAGVQPAIIQYIEPAIAHRILTTYFCASIEAKSSITTQGAISFYYLNTGNLPNVATGTNNSIVQSLNADGSVNAFNTVSGNNWVAIPNVFAPNSSIYFSAATSGTATFNFTDLGRWGRLGNTATQTCSYMAVVAGFPAMALGQTISINSISMTPGTITTRPAPQSQNAVIADCQRYYEKSFATGTTPNSGSTIMNGIMSFGSPVGASTAFIAPPVTFNVEKRATPTITVYGYSVITMNQIFDYTTTTSCTGTALVANPPNSGTRFFTLTATTPAGANTQDNLIYHWSADSRLGIVN